MWNRIYFSNQELSWQFRPWIISLKQLQLVPWLNNKQIQVTYSTHFTLTPTISHLLHPFHTYSTHFTLTPPISHLLHPFHTYSTHFTLTPPISVLTLKLHPLASAIKVFGASGIKVSGAFLIWCKDMLFRLLIFTTISHFCYLPLCFSTSTHKYLKNIFW